MRTRARKIRIVQITKADETKGSGSQTVVLKIPRNTRIKVKRS